MQCIKAAGEEFIPKIQQSLLMVWNDMHYDCEQWHFADNLMYSPQILERVFWVLMFHLK